MIVIGLTGKAGAGKSAVADYLVEAHGFTKLSFAGPLKKMLRTLDPIVDSEDGYIATSLSEVFITHGNDEALIKRSKYGEEYRRLLQVLGTDCIRAVDEDFWVRAAMQQLTDPDGKYVFDDVRFPNEASAVYWASLGTGFDPAVWHVDRPNYDGGAGAHESETHAGRMGETLTITNYSSGIEALHKQVDHLVKMHEFEEAAA